VVLAISLQSWIPITLLLPTG